MNLDSRVSSRNSKLGRPEYEAEMLTQHLIFNFVNQFRNTHSGHPGMGIKLWKTWAEDRLEREIKDEKSELLTLVNGKVTDFWDAT
jgi:hypothetical protein